jgi:hypothetical protein
VGEKKEGWGVIGKTAISFLPLIRNRGRGTEPSGRLAGGGGGRRRSRARRRPGTRAKWRGGRGGSIPLPTLGCDGVQRWIGGGGRREVVPAMGGGAPVLWQGREVAVVVRDEAGNGVGYL